MAPQRIFFGELIGALASQDNTVQSLVDLVDSLLPGPRPLCAEAPAYELLRLPIASTTRLGQDAPVLAGITTSLATVAARTPPHELTSAFTASHFDMSANSLTPLQFVEAGDPGAEPAGPVLLNEALHDYEAEITAAAIRAFWRRTPVRSGSVTSAQEVVDAALAEIRVLGGRDRTADMTPGGHARDTLPVQEPGPGPDLKLTDVFDLKAGAAWRAEFRAYFPLFTFVFSALRELERSERALAELVACARTLLGHVAPGPDEETQPANRVTAARMLVALSMPGGKITGIVEARRLAWTMREWYPQIRQVAAMVDAAAGNLVRTINSVLARERAGFLAEIGIAPRLDAVAPAEIERVARDMQDSTELHLRLTRTLVTEAAAIIEHGQWPAAGVNSSGLRASLTATAELVDASAAALSGGQWLRALTHLSDVRLPLLPADFLGLKFHQDALAQARPLGVLALLQQMVAARWTVGAVAAYPPRRRRLAEAIFAEVTAFERAHREQIYALGATLARASYRSGPARNELRTG